MNTIINNQGAADAKRLFNMHLAMFTDPAMTKEDYASLWTADAVQEYPYAPAPYSSAIEGREAIAAYIENVTKSATDWHFTNISFSPTADRDTVYVEFEGSALVTATGKRYKQIYVARITMQRGKISKYREFWNPAWIIDAFV